MPYGLINTVRSILLHEDADIPANNVGGGRVAGIGVPNPDISGQAEPGVEQRRHRRRKRLQQLKRSYREGADVDAIQKELDQLLSEALAAGGEVELMEYALQEAEAEALDHVLAEAEAAVETEQKKRKNKKVMKLRDGSSVVVNPELGGNRLGEDRVRVGGMQRVDLLIRLGVGDPTRIWYYRAAIMDPEAAVKSPTLRKYVGEVLERVLDILFSDAQAFNRFRAILQKQDKPRGEDTLPEGSA